MVCEPFYHALQMKYGKCTRLLKFKNKLKLVIFTNKVGKNSRYFMGFLNKTIISIALVSYEMVIRASLAMYHLISNAHSWNKLLSTHLWPLLYAFSIIALMIIENRALWLARSFASSRYNHRAVIITLKTSSFQNGSQICWCLGVGNWSIILFSRIIINAIILKQLVASGD